LFTTPVLQTAATALHPSYAGSLSSNLMLCALCSSKNPSGSFIPLFTSAMMCAAVGSIANWWIAKHSMTPAGSSNKAPSAGSLYFTYSYLCTYDLYSPVHNVLDACISITRASGRGLGPGNRDFFRPFEMASSQQASAIWGQKTKEFPCTATERL
jgi:hypothetical protein